jgi:uncharacterized repeat protein (TIGR03803 family)
MSRLCNPAWALSLAPIILCGTVLSSCSQGLTPAGRSVPPDGDMRPATAGYHQLYPFKGGTDGRFPTGAFIDGGGVWYGTTGGGRRFQGTVFAFTPSGGEHVVHLFRHGKSEGELPDALTVLDGTLYGTTRAGGTNGFGTVFSVTPSGSLHVVYAFAGGQDGATPAAITTIDGKLYGVTESGGINNAGTVFELTTSGSERVLYRFADGTDGRTPGGWLVVKGHTIYGTTNTGGSDGCYSVGCGIVFSVTTAGVERVVYAFQGGNDGEYPSTLIMLDGALYGTTPFGGPDNEGTVFTISASGQERVLHSFGGGADGYYPSGLIAVDHKLYGTTGFGNASFIGALFELSKSGQEKTLYQFTGQRAGEVPWGHLIYSNGVLYAISAYGGFKSLGNIYSYTL